MPSKKPGRGQKGSTESLRPDPLRIAKMVADLVEMAPRILYDLELMVGAHEPLTPPVPDQPRSAVLEVTDHKDGRKYQIVVVPKEQKTAAKASAETESRASGS